MKSCILTVLSSLFLCTSLFGQQGINISGMLHQANWEMTQHGFGGGGGVKVQLLGKEALRGMPIRLQTGLSATYLKGETRRFADFNQFGSLSNSVSLANHATRLGMNLRALTWPGTIRLFAEVEAGGQYVFATSNYGYRTDLSSLTNHDNLIGGSLGYYYGYGGGLQYRLLPFLYAQLGVHIVEGSGAKIVDLNSATFTNNSLQYSYERSPSTGFTEYTLGLYFRFGNHDSSRRKQQRQRKNNNRRTPGKRPSYWDRG